MISGGIQERTAAAQEYAEKGFAIASNLVSESLLQVFQDEIRAIGQCLAPDLGITDTTTIDDVWFALARKDRNLAGCLYDATKHLLVTKRIALEDGLIDYVRALLGKQAVCLVDVLVRIDAPSEQKFLFDWHQDYWFSICSKKAIVCWIPLLPLTPETGGIEVIPNTATGGRIFKVRRNPTYHSYSNSVLIDEDVDASAAVRLAPEIGSCAFFQFNVLHRSLPNVSSNQCRWTLQLRYGAYDDVEFQQEKYRLGVVNADRITYLERVEKK